MTIRYQCAKCDSVLKIQDELAGKGAKCPKCKTAFVIPPPSEKSGEKPAKSPAKEKAAAAKSKASRAKKKAAEPAAPKHPPVDFPLEITPAVKPADTDLYKDSPSPAAGAEPSAPVNRPSIADLMRDHEASKQKKSSSAGKDTPAIEVPTASGFATSGSAADALTRNYDQKRGAGEAEAAPSLTREERRALEQKEALIAFVKKFAPIAAGVGVLLFACVYFLFYRTTLPPLGYVDGVVKVDGAPAAGYSVSFALETKGGEERPEDSQTCTGLTDANGNYTLMYTAGGGLYEGVLPGTHTVTIATPDGLELGIPDADRHKTVNEGESHEYNFSGSF